MLRCDFSNVAFAPPESSLVKVVLKSVLYMQDISSDVMFIRCSFENITAKGNGSCISVTVGDNRRVKLSECSFVNVHTTGGHGGAIYIQCPSLNSLLFTAAGMGFTFSNIGNGAYVCDPLCALKPEYNGRPSADIPFYGQVIYIVLTDAAVATVPYTGDHLEGLKNRHIDYRYVHIRGWPGPPEGQLFTMVDLVGEQVMPYLECEQINATAEPDLCNKNVNGPACRVEVDDRGEPFCAALDSEKGEGGSGASDLCVKKKKKDVVFFFFASVFLFFVVFC